MFDVYTLGLSNRTWIDTVETLNAFGIRRLVDIRTSPRSRHTPQFNEETLRTKLPEAGIDYVHLKSLGGWRKPVKDSSVNAAWKNASFRGYADYMQTPEFEKALTELTRLFRETVTVYACTESVFWRCHRQLVSDALVVRGYRVGHIFDSSKVQVHKLSEFVRSQGTRLTYPSLL
jgi:uncharacterized protein (DUF488 family)